MRLHSAYNVLHGDVSIEKMFDETTGCGIKSSPPPGVFGSFLGNGLKFKCEVLYTYVENRYVHTGVDTI